MSPAALTGPIDDGARDVRVLVQHGTDDPLIPVQRSRDLARDLREFGIPTLLFGPRGAGSHNPNEYVEVVSVLRTAEVYLAAALEWCG